MNGPPNLEMIKYLSYYVMKKPSDFCHRHIIAEEIYDIKIPEFGLNCGIRKNYKYISVNTIDIW
jgi:hypothetical protein